MVGKQRKVADPLFFANAQPHYDQSEKHRAVRQRSHSDTITVDQHAFPLQLRGVRHDRHVPVRQIGRLRVLLHGNAITQPAAIV